jgi:hypothetical protein
MDMSMGTLKPGATYIYERVDDTVFRRESGATEREVVGYDHRTSDGRPLTEHMREDQLWGNIRRAAQTNPTLQDALDSAKMIYHLSKKT